MISVPGLKPGRSDALVEQVDLFPTLVEAATLNIQGGPISVPHCPGDTEASRGTALCTEGFSLMPLLHKASSPWPRAAFSQFVRSNKCCDCATPISGSACCPCSSVPTQPKPASGDIMGYTVRVDRYRYTGWFSMNQSSARPNFTHVVAREFYTHNEPAWPIDWDWEHENVVEQPQYVHVVAQLHKVIVQCGQRPDICPVELLAGLVH